MDSSGAATDHAAMDHSLLLLCAAIFLAAGLVKGLSGMGLPTLSMALLGLTALSPAKAAALMVLPSLLTNIAQCLGSDWRALLRQLWPMWCAMVAATLWSPLPALGSSASGAAAHELLGGVLVVYGIWGLAKPRLPQLQRGPRLIGAAAGLLSGLLAAGTGVFVMPMVPYLQALRLEKAAMMQAMGISFTLGMLALAARLGSGLPDVSGVGVLVAVVAAFAGLALGNRLVGRLGAATFQRVLYAVFLALGGLMLING